MSTPPPTAPAADEAARLTLRPADRSDESAVAFFCDTALRRDYFLRRGQLSEMLTGTRHRVLLAELDGVLVGLAVLTRGARLVNALVHPAYRGLGIGRALVELAAPHEVRCKHDMSTGDPGGFYAALGYAPTGEHNPKGNIELLRRAQPTTKET